MASTKDDKNKEKSEFTTIRVSRSLKKILNRIQNDRDFTTAEEVIEELTKDAGEYY